MTAELFAMLVDHLANGTEPRRNHARYRLSLPDAAGHELPEGWTPPPVPPPTESPALGIPLGGCCH